MSKSSSSENQREREVQRLYQGWLSSRGSSLNVALNVDSIALTDLHGTGYKPQSSRDKTLSAFAQLAVLKLGVRRAMVSLIDRDTQMILAESTSGAAAVTNEDDLWLGSTVLTRSDAVCEHAMRNTYTAHDPVDPSITYTAPALVVPDCRLDSRFDARPYVLSEPGVRFYAGVPIVSPLGHRVGVYAVSDEKPHDGLTIDELKFMEEVADTIMEHFEASCDRLDRFKGERIVRGLAAFIEGSYDADSPARDPSAKSAEAQQPRMSLSTRRKPLPRRSSYRGSNADGQPSRGGRETPPLKAGSPTASPRASPSRVRSHDYPRRRNSLKGDPLSRMYTEAAEILRQSTLADGVVLFGASAGNNRHLKSAIGGALQSSDDDDVSASVTSGSEGIGLDSSDSDSAPASRPCKVLACALADNKARADIEQGSALSLGALERYFTLFPRGKVFSFTTEGAGISSEDDSASDREPNVPSADDAMNGAGGGRKRRTPRMDHKELLKRIPGAKSVVFVPLYDNSEDRFAGGCFLWTSVMGRMMKLDGDLSYLQAFSNSIMSEVARINTQKNEAAKTTFIASISHELRSPLHGILGAAEFLMDTAVDSYQSGLVTSVSTCGKTLLDTLNHLLDYSKINKLGRSHIRKNARQNRIAEPTSDQSMESMSMTAVVDLAILVEEVVDAVTAGNTFDKLPGAVLSKVSKSNVSGSINTMSGGHQPLTPPEDGPVSVLLDICPRASWMVRTQPGALRRIIMNLLGNALKYTSSGFVQVSLRAQELGSGAGSKTSAVIKVVDTGKGMSEEFQRDRLFVPFSQEDTFQPGTGLGLSIVKQIVDSLGGSIEVVSEQYRGTEITVRLDLATAPDHSVLQPDEEIHTIAERTKGHKLRLLDCAHPYQSPALNQQIHKLDKSILATCNEWFGMDASKENETDEEADLFLYCEPPSVEALQQRFRQSNAQQKPKDIPIIIVCLNANEAIRISQNQCKILTDLGKIVEVIPQPCGPRKLAKVFSHCLQRAEEVLNEHNDADDDSDATWLSPSQKMLRDKAEHARSPEVPQIRIEPMSPPSPDQAEIDAARARQLETPPSIDLAGPSPPPLDPMTPPLQEVVLESLAKTMSSDKPASTDNSNTSSNIINNNTSKTKPRARTHVLLVDDNHINLQLLVMFMKKCGYSYEQAENGQQALDKYIEAHRANSGIGPADAASPPFDFVLMDISMPVMNGIESTRRIRDFECENELPKTNVIALTGLASADAQRDAKLAGMDVFLPKPVRFAELKKLLQREV